MPTNLATREEIDSAETKWFGVAGPIFAWLALGMGDILITWRLCVNPERFGAASPHPAARLLYFVITVALFLVAGVAGAICYKNWKRLAGLTNLLQAEGRERREFLGLAGMFMSLTLGMGIVWLCLPLFIVQMCIRAR